MSATVGGLAGLGAGMLGTSIAALSAAGSISGGEAAFTSMTGNAANAGGLFQAFGGSDSGIGVSMGFSTIGGAPAITQLPLGAAGLVSFGLSVGGGVLNNWFEGNGTNYDMSWANQEQAWKSNYNW